MSKTIRIALAAGAMALAASPTWAASLQVAPTTIDLPAKGGNAVLYVNNNGAGPIGVHVEGFAWSQKDGTDELEPSTALQLSPPMTSLKPGERQTIRLRVKPQKDGEQAFRLVASELPDAADHLHNGVKVLFQFSVPVFVGGEGPSEHHGLAWQLSKSAAGETLSVRSEGTTYSKLSGLKIVPMSGSSTDVGHGQIVYVLPGASEHWDVAGLSVTQGEKLRVEAYDDRHHREVTFPVTAGL